MSAVSNKTVFSDFFKPFSDTHPEYSKHFLIESGDFLLQPVHFCLHSNTKRQQLMKTAFSVAFFVFALLLGAPLKVIGCLCTKKIRTITPSNQGSVATSIPIPPPALPPPPPGFVREQPSLRISRRLGSSHRQNQREQDLPLHALIRRDRDSVTDKEIEEVFSTQPRINLNATDSNGRTALYRALSSQNPLPLLVKELFRRRATFEADSDVIPKEWFKKLLQEWAPGDRVTLLIDYAPNREELWNCLFEISKDDKNQFTAAASRVASGLLIDLSSRDRELAKKIWKKVVESIPQLSDVHSIIDEYCGLLHPQETQAIVERLDSQRQDADLPALSK